MAGNLRSRRLAEALDAGVATYLIGVLVVTLLALPALAGHSDFGHRHLSTSPDHHHTMGQILTVGGPAPRAALPTQESRVALPVGPQRYAPVAGGEVELPWCRAPPQRA